MRGELGDRQPVPSGNAGDLVAISLGIGRLLQIEQARIPGRNLHTLVTERRCPLADRVKRVERSRIPCELRQENGWAFDRLHDLPPLRLLANTISSIAASDV